MAAGFVKGRKSNHATVVWGRFGPRGIPWLVMICRLFYSSLVLRMI